MQDNYYVYTHSRPNGEVFYVGKGKGNRCYVMNRRNKHHKNIVEKYGVDNIIVIKVIEFISERAAISEEIALIARLRLSGISLANMTDGGEGMSGFCMSDETKKKLSDMNSGENHPMYGKKRPQEVLDKMSKALKGRVMSEETRTRMSNSRKGEKNIFWGKPLPIETCRKISTTLLRDDNPARGVPRTDEVKAKISKANSGENNGMFGMFGRCGEQHPNYGKEYSAESKKKMSEAHLDVPLSESHRASLSKFQQSRWDKLTALQDSIRTKVINEFLFEQMVNS